PQPPRRHALRCPRLYPAHLGRPRVHRGLAPLPQGLRPRSRHPRSRPGRGKAAPTLVPVGRAHGAGPVPAGPGGRAARPGAARAGAPFFWARTQYAGASLLMPQALAWLATARGCCADACGTLHRGLLTSAFALVVGLERVSHLDEMNAVGFAVLTGGRRGPSREAVGCWRRHLRWQQVDAFCRRTCPWHLLRGADAILSFDEHAIPRWTRKFRIKKGYVTTRDKSRRCEKLFYGYDVQRGRFLSVRGTPGAVGLADLAVPLVEQALTCGRPRTLHALCDAGAGKAAAAGRALGDRAGRGGKWDVPLGACRYPHRLRQWKRLPSGLFVSFAEPGVCVEAPPKEIRLAETQTVLKGEGPEQAVRTIVCREVVPGPKKDRWHPLHTTSAGFPEDVLGVFRARQRHEQAYRVGVYDEFLDAVPCGYDKDSRNPKRPGFQRGPLQLVGWLVALVYNAVADLAEGLDGEFAGAHVRTLRRMFFNRPGQLYSTPEALLVYLDPFAGQDALVPVIDRFNAAGHRIPWLEDRR